MIIGNITISSKPKSNELRDCVICSSCLEKCDEVPVDDSFDDQFGNVTCWSVGSNCCGAECFEGRIYLEKYRVHVARKDFPKQGIKAGQKYRAKIIKGYYIDENNKHVGIYEYSRKLIQPKVTT